MYNIKEKHEITNTIFIEILNVVMNLVLDGNELYSSMHEVKRL